ncbi:hypothetical protein [Trichothermofontia sp.]
MPTIIAIGHQNRLPRSVLPIAWIGYPNESMRSVWTRSREGKPTEKDQQHGRG